MINPIIYIGNEEIIENNTKALSEFITKFTNGFISLAESYIEQQKELSKSIKDAVHRLEHLHNYEKLIIRFDIPHFHTLNELTRGMLLLMKSVFSDKCQSITKKEILFGLTDKEVPYQEYKDIIPSELSTELQSKLELVYDKKIKNEADTSDIESVKYYPAFSLPLQASKEHNSVEKLGYGDIHDLIKFGNILIKCNHTLLEELPVFINHCKESNTLATKALSNLENEYDQDKVNNIIKVVSIWGYLSEASLKCSLFYTRAYLEILNTIYNSTKKD